MKLRTILTGISALALLSLLSGCIYVDRGHGGGHCAVPPQRTVCETGHWGHGR